MKPLLALTAGLSLACAIPHSGEPIAIPISVSSHNRSIVDLYLLCGDHDAQWLGTIQPKDGGLFEAPASRVRCARGLNFFLVHRDQGRGYWVGPFFPARGSSIQLTIEPYAGLSFARVDHPWR